ncbi:FAD-dependent oxidoreductase [Undibacterium amnicola]|uniref:FAD-dependent oxidoreductase n=1 Tax=Undibacterium amnicola TaxID=1834038 RepID=A0ABR6XM87_9BURK|nr:FAD-dependent oxidoreductase [Undibacterium amnicola]MBC3830540.1 FAD-dependent oxidoreductase [Undibacterium amnicola]
MTHKKQKIAVVGAGISGLTSAYFLQQQHDVTLFEANRYLGGHTNTVDIEIDQKTLVVDTGFLVFNDKTYPNLIALFAELGIESYSTDMSFGVSLDDGRLEWAGTNLDTVFAQRKNLISPSFLGMIQDILRFNRDAERNLKMSIETGISLGQLLHQQKYKASFANQYLIPMAAAIWSSSPKDILDFPARTFLRFCINHALLQVNDRPQWRTVQNGARSYVRKIAETLKDARLNSPVSAVKRTEQAVMVTSKGSTELFDQVIFATHAPDTLSMLTDASEAEYELLSKARYQANTAYLHTDISLLPRSKKVWSAWNYIGQSADAEMDGSAQTSAVCVSYLLNQLQRLDTQTPVIVTLNPIYEPQPESVFAKFEYAHPVFDQKAIDTQRDLSQIQGKNKAWFAGAWTGYGFHEDGLKSALRVVKHFDLSPAWARTE